VEPRAGSRISPHKSIGARWVVSTHSTRELEKRPQSANRTHAAPATVAVRKCDLPESQVPPAEVTSGKWLM